MDYRNTVRIYKTDMARKRGHFYPLTSCFIKRPIGNNTVWHLRGLPKAPENVAKLIPHIKVRKAEAL